MSKLLALLLILAPVPKDRREYVPPAPSEKSTANELVWWSSTGTRFVKAIGLIDDTNNPNHCIVADWVYMDLCNANDSDELAEQRLWILRHAREVMGGPPMLDNK